MAAGLLVDTDILIDCLRGDSLTIRQLGLLEQDSSINVSVVTQMELLVGCRNKNEQRGLTGFLKRFHIIEISEEVSTQAVELLKMYRLSHGLLIPDALIAATAIIMEVPLLTKNHRDFRFIESLELKDKP